VADPDRFAIWVDDLESTYSRERFYGNAKFREATRQYYQNLDRDCEFIKGRRGWILKIYSVEATAQYHEYLMAQREAEEDAPVEGADLLNDEQ